MGPAGAVQGCRGRAGGRPKGSWRTLEAEAGPLPDKEKLRQAQGELAYLKTLEASQKEAQNQREPARRAVDRAEQAAADPVFDGMDPDQAWKRANEDAARPGSWNKRGRRLKWR